jgi:hypothetical protein
MENGIETGFSTHAIIDEFNTEIGPCAIRLKFVSRCHHIVYFASMPPLLQISNYAIKE